MAEQGIVSIAARSLNEHPLYWASVGVWFNQRVRTRLAFFPRRASDFGKCVVDGKGPPLLKTNCPLGAAQTTRKQLALREREQSRHGGCNCCPFIRSTSAGFVSSVRER